MRHIQLIYRRSWRPSQASSRPAATERPGDAMRPAAKLAPQPHNRLDYVLWQGVTAGPGAGRTVLQPGDALIAVASPPLGDRAT